MARGPRAKVKVNPARVASGDRGYAPAKPVGMGSRAAAKWDELVPMIARVVQLRDVDADALRQFCEASVLREKAVAELETAPLLMVNPNGSAFANPLVKLIKEQNGIMTRLAERFGLDPASRKRLQIEAVKADSAFAEFLARTKSRPRPELA